MVRPLRMAVLLVFADSLLDQAQFNSHPNPLNYRI